MILGVTWLTSRLNETDSLLVYLARSPTVTAGSKISSYIIVRSWCRYHPSCWHGNCTDFLDSYEYATVHAHVTDQLPAGFPLILGQGFLRKCRCTKECGRDELRFTLTRFNHRFRIKRFYVKQTCKSRAHLADTTHSQCLSLTHAP